MTSEPLQQFRHWYEGAVAAGVVEPEAMALATADADGMPSVRFVLLKGIDDRGVEFFTNYESRKGRELIANPRAALAVLWKPPPAPGAAGGPRRGPAAGGVRRLLRHPLTRIPSSGRGPPRQSEVIPDREWLEARLAEVDAQYPGDVPRPPHWGGFRLLPTAVEFWEGQPSRLHDRELFTRGADGAWQARRLSP